jgi:hypothetical protein
MTDLTDYTENWIMNWMRGTTAPPAPVNLYVGLYSTNPTETGVAGTEITTTIRPAGRLPAGFAAISGGQIVNSAQIDFGAAAGAATIAYIGLHDAASGGNMVAYRGLTAPYAVAIAGSVKIAASALTFSIT